MYRLTVLNIMPNWSSVTYKITGKKNELNDFKNEIEIAINNKKYELNLWLLYRNLGAAYLERGLIYAASIEDNVLTFSIDYAWKQDPMFIYLLQECYPSFDIYYEEFEPGMRIWETNDVNGIFFKERFWLTVQNYKDGDFEEEFFETQEQVFEYINKTNGTEIKSIEEYDKFVREMDEVVDESDGESGISYCLMTIDIV